jgi:hypothetical protein
MTAFLAKQAPDPVRTYTSVIDPGDSDDPWVAAALGQMLGLTSRFVRFALDAEALALVPLIAWSAEGDFDLGFLSRYQIASAARADGVKVLLSGQGADELTTGYHRSYEEFASDAARASARRKLIDSNRFDIASALNPEVHPNLEDVVSNQLSRDHAGLSEYLLRYEDRMGMLAGVEIRVPYLDESLVNLCARIPPSRRSKLFSNKHIVREAAEKVLPGMFSRRPKLAFNASLPPISRVLSQTKDALPQLRDLLTSEATRERGYFRVSAVERAFQTRDYRALDAVLVIHLLDDLFVRNFDPLRYAPPAKPEIRNVEVDPFARPMAKLRAMVSGLAAETVPSLDPAVVRIGVAQPIGPSSLPDSNRTALMAWLADGQALDIPVESDNAAEASAISNMVLFADGARTYADIASLIGIPVDVALSRARPLHVAGILRPLLRAEASGSDG